MGLCQSCFGWLVRFTYEPVPVTQDEDLPRRHLRPKHLSLSEGNINGAPTLPIEFSNYYELGPLIGTGATSQVFALNHAILDVHLACKIVDKRKLDLRFQHNDMLLHQLRQETSILRCLCHPNIVRFYDFIETNTSLYIIMERVDGQDVFELVSKFGPMTENAARKIMTKVLMALEYTHDRGVVHRDIKADNVIIQRSSCSDTFDVKLIDFGFSKILHNDLTGSYLGTSGYVAPEIRQERLYGTPIDIWATGVLLYLILSASLPFANIPSKSSMTVAQLRQQMQLTFEKRQWNKISVAAKDLIARMLVIDPIKRYTATQALEHPWLQGFDVMPATRPSRHVLKERKKQRAAQLQHYQTMGTRPSIYSPAPQLGANETPLSSSLPLSVSKCRDDTCSSLPLSVSKCRDDTALLHPVVAPQVNGLACSYGTINVSKKLFKE